MGTRGWEPQPWLPPPQGGPPPCCWARGLSSAPAVPCAKLFAEDCPGALLGVEGGDSHGCDPAPSVGRHGGAGERQLAQQVAMMSLDVTQ